MSIGTTLAAARETRRTVRRGGRRGDPDPPHPGPGIENDDFSACGGDFYARGHIRTIAATVGADPAPLLAEFDASPSRRPPPPRATEVFESETAAWPERRGGPNWSAAMAAALVLVVAYGVVQAFTGAGGGGHDVADRGAARASAPPATSRRPRRRPRPATTARWPRRRAARSRWRCGPPTAAGCRSRPRAARSCSRGCCSRGQDKTFTDTPGSSWSIGNAGGVELTVNGTEIGAPGRRGQVARVQFTPRTPRRADGAGVLAAAR